MKAVGMVYPAWTPSLVDAQQRFGEGEKEKMREKGKVMKICHSLVYRTLDLPSFRFL